MDIQHWEKESLAAYIHWFKTKAKKCNFTNDTVTIKIFVKGLKKCTQLRITHLWKRTSSTYRCHLRYGKTQCCTATHCNDHPILSSQCDVEWRGLMFLMSRTWYTTWHCPHIRCNECDKYSHIIMDCPHIIPPSRTPATHHKKHIGQHTRLSSRYHQ